MENWQLFEEKMIDRNSSAYKEAIWRVKIGHAFLEKGYDIKGVMHVGANDGYEIQYYFDLGIEHVLAFEPLPAAAQRFYFNYRVDMAAGRCKFYMLALGATNESRELFISPGDGQGSSFLVPTDEYRKQHPEYDYDKFPPVRVNQLRFDTFLKQNPGVRLDDYDCLVIDTQGTELEVLRGMGNFLYKFRYLNIECSKVPVYQNSVAASEIISYLSGFGFRQDSPIEDHDDIFFIK